MFYPWQRWLINVGITILAIAVIWQGSLPAQADIRDSFNNSGQVIYGSHQTLKDLDGHPWQVVLFKETGTGDSNPVHLRLVGFPGMASFRHPAPLTIHSGATELTLPDQFAQQSPGENVGQYEFLRDFETIPGNGIWELQLPLQGADLVIKVPYFVLQEWRTVMTKAA